MIRVLTLFCLVLALAEVNGEKNSEADFHKLPKLFHLDDFERCLAKQDGIYCLGQFEVYSDVQQNPIYDIIQEKSQDVRLYNRSYLHRGYCLSTRCPSREGNATARFERCVDASAQRYSLRARLRTLNYCRAHGQPRSREPDTTDLPHRVVLYFAYTMLVMAVIGTSYDLYYAKKGRKNPLLMSFSLRVNWGHLTTNFQDVNPRLRELELLNLIKFLLGVGLVLCHVFILTSVMYQHNPKSMEKMLSAPSGFIIGVGMIFTLTFVLISNFLTTYYILLDAKTEYTLKHFPLIVLKRVIRIYPVYLFLNGFAATWWKSFGDGPMWPVLVASESEICRKKFWVTAAFLQNFINKKELCLVQTWIMAVDMQLHLFTLFLTILLLKHRQHAVKVFSMLFVVATILLAYQAFAQDLIPCYLYMTPEVLRNIFLGADSFFDLYINPMNGLLFAIAGTMLAFMHTDHQKRGVNMSNSKILVFLHHITVPVIILWYYICYSYFRHYDRWTQHIMVVVERVVVALLTSFFIYSVVHHKGFIYRMTSWRVLRTLTKLSLSMSMCHWCVNVLLLTDRWTLHDSTGIRIIHDIIGVHVIAHIIAVPLTLFVEYPMQKFLDRLLKLAFQGFLKIKAQ